jgi:chromosome partitioning protein
MDILVAVVQSKGGVGKTTLAVSLSAELAKRGRDIALIDADPQRSACDWAAPGHLQFPVHEIALAGQTISQWICETRQVSANYVVIDTAPNVRALAVSSALASLVLVPCTPSGLDLASMVQTLEIVDMVRARRNGDPKIILVPNRVDACTLEGQQLADELVGFGEVVSSTIGDRSVFARSFSVGSCVAEIAAGEAADCEIRLLCDLVERSFASFRRYRRA